MVALYASIKRPNGLQLEEFGPFYRGVKGDQHLSQLCCIVRADFAAAVEIQADGDELELIKSQFQNIPTCSNHVVRYRGDIADFIFWNLKLQ
jgi:hypothetical protein